MANISSAELVFDKGYGNRFRALRKSLKINGMSCSVRKLSEILQIDFVTITNIENESRKPSYKHLKLYHDFFGVSYDFLISGNDFEQTKDIVVELMAYTALDETTLEVLHKLSNNKEFNKVISSVIKTISTIHKEKEC